MNALTRLRSTMLAGALALLALGQVAVAAPATRSPYSTDLEIDPATGMPTPAYEARMAWQSDGTRPVILAQLHAFFGAAAGPYFPLGPEVPRAHRRLVADQFEQVFQGPGEAAITLPDGRRLLSTFVAHDAGERSAVVTNGDSATIVAAALVDGHCGKWNTDPPGTRHPRGDLSCDDTLTLTVFYSGAIAPDPALTQELRDWAASWADPYLAHTRRTLRFDQRVLKGNDYPD